ncbi:MAG: hypothetical protein H7Y88_04810 [Phycisphaerales bacterium]|nr:hypothetical protein [Phycisphaerales bacterium]
MFTQSRFVPCVCCAALALLSPAALAQSPDRGLPDLRGITFLDYHITDNVGGTISGNPIIANLVNDTLTPIPHTFTVDADPAFPLDPSRIILRTRLTSGSVGPGGIIDPNGIVYFDLPGTYNQTTGAFDVSGTAPGTTEWNLGTNDLGLFPVPADWTVWARLTDPTLSLNGIVSIVNGNPFITGLNSTPSFPGPGNLDPNTSLIDLFLLPPGLFDPALSPAPPIPVADPFYGFSWTAAIPAPSTAALLGIPAALALRRRRTE